MRAGLGVGRVGPAVDPGAGALERDGRARRVGQELAVVADDEDRLRRRRDAPLQAALGRHVEEVVGLVEQQHVGVGGEDELEHELLALAARELVGAAGADLVEARADDRPRGRVPPALELVAAELRPRRDRLAERHPGLGRVGAGVEVALGLEHRRPRRAQAARGEVEQQLADRPHVAVEAHVLAHEDVARAERDLALVERQVAGQAAQERALADAVGADERRRGRRAPP